MSAKNIATGAMPFIQVIKRNGGDDETRTRDLYRDS
jgi:hypothetical protein